MKIIYQAYGKDENIQQALFSLTSLLYQTRNSAGAAEENKLHFLIYTDQPQKIKNYCLDQPGIEIFPMSSTLIEKWKGPLKFVHRLKIEMLIHAGAKEKGPMVYLDGDTYFLQDPRPTFAEISEFKSLMHLSENKIEEGRDPLSKKICKFIKKETFQTKNGLLQISPQTVMWNAGVIGISEKNKSFLPKILEITDILYEKYQKHIMEQLAVSHVLQKHTQVIPCDEIIEHYWSQKEAYQVQIQNFLEKNKTITEGVKNFSSFEKPSAPIQKKKSFFEKLLSN